jgi:hypothetical protein
MPNWCDNAGFIQVTDRTTERGREIFEKLAKHGREANWFSTVMPVPAEMHLGLGCTSGNREYMSLDWLRANSKFAGDFGAFTKDDENTRGEFKPSQEYTDYLKRTFGATDWYHWSVKNWGTKWDVELTNNYVYDHSPDTLHFFFSSAWGPPVEFFTWLSKEELDWSLDYIEPGNCFAGTASYIDGESSHTEYTDEDMILFGIDHFGMEIEFFTSVENYDSFDEYTANHKHGERVTEFVIGYYALRAEHAEQRP